jgi:ATP-dependent DNA helicase RecG
MVTGSEDELSQRRLAALVETSDGFKLSEIDLELRGEGDVLGEDQSGRASQLKMLKVTRDAEIIETAREIALELVKKELPAGLQRGIELMELGALASG